MRNIKMAAAAFIVMMLFIPSITASASSCGETVRQNTTADLQAVHYENNETIGKLLAPSRYTLSEKLNKKTEIARREGKSPADISDEQAVKELNQDNVKVMSFEETFAEVQAEIGDIIQKVVDHTEGAENRGANYYTNRIQQNKEKLLLGLTYLERLYDFNMGGHNVKDALLYESKPYIYVSMYGMIDNVLDWLIYIGGSGGDTLKISNNANVFGYGKIFGPVTSSATLDAFLEENRKKWMPDTPMNDWFLQESSAYILDNRSAWDGRDTGIYRRLYDNTASRSYILPLLSVSEDSIYMIANSTTITYGIVDCYIDRNLRETDPAHYAELREKFQQQLEQAAKQQQAFIDCWYRIAKPEKKNQLSSDRIVLDSLRIDPDTPNTAVQWSDKFGKNAARGVREFFTPLNLYGSYMFADGVAEGQGIRYYISKALTERGFATYAHELTHILVSNVMLNGYGSRDGMMAEVYTRGMFEPYELNDPPAYNLNLIYDRLDVSDRYHNGRPERFQDETDLQSYMSGIMDVVYTLDYAEADVMLTKSAQDKKKWFHKLEQIEDPSERDNQGEEGSRHNLDSVRELTLEEAEGLNTIDDLIRDCIITSRYEVNGTVTTGTAARNGYYVVPLFSSNYAGVQNNHGVSGDLMIRQQAFELLAEYGYYDGMVPYISNQYKESARLEQTILSDRYVLEKIFDGAYETMADFKKAMFQRRIEKINELKPVTIMWKSQSVTINNFEKLRLLMKEAIESDLVKVNVLPGGSNNIRAQATEVERLKQEIFKSYIIQTKDFSDSIYGANLAPIDPPEPEQPGETDPEQPGETDPEQPGETDPEKPGETNPGQPGETDPEKPGETNPGQPGETDPEKPGETNPGQPGETDPEKPGETNPGQPGETDPEKPGETNPGQPGETDPEKPGETNPGQPGETDPEKPGETNPGQPGETDPEKPGETDPEKPGETNPGQPGETDPEKPGETNPGQPGETDPEKPGETNPGQPGETDPEKPGETNPGQPGETDPEKPGETNPEQPGETDPGKPGGTESAEPDKPGETISEQPGGNSGKEVPLKLLLCRVSSAKTSHTIRWNPVKSADGYEIYGAKSNGKYKRLKTVSKKTDKWKHKKLNRGTQYKYYVKAYKKIGGKRVILAKSLPVFGTTKGGKYTNPSKIEVKKIRMSVDSGKKVQIHIKVTGKKISKAGKKVRYVSSDPSVAKVSEKGSITGKKRGSCIIYCIAQNGLYKKVKVKVNS